MNTNNRTRCAAKSSGSRPGTVLVLAALSMIVVLLFVALSIDWGFIVLTESELQNAADAGAMSGARGLSKGRDAAMDAAQLWAGKNRAARTSVALDRDADVEIGVWDDLKATFTVLAADSKVSPNAVRVTCRRTASRGNPLQLFFGRALGTKTANVERSAIAKVKTSRCGLIIGIPSVTMSGSSVTDSYNAESGSYVRKAAGQNGHVCSNGDITMSGSAEIKGNAHPGPGKIVKTSGSAAVSGTKSALTQALDYPPADPGDAATVNNNSKIPLSEKKKAPLNSKNEFSLSGGDAVDLPPGTYYFSKMSLSGSSTINISGPTTIYVTGDVDLSGGSTANLTLKPKNLQLFPMGDKCTISGSSEFYGLVYAPNTEVVRSGSADYYGAIIAGKLVLSGSGGIHADESLDSQILGGSVQKATLVE